MFEDRKRGLVRAVDGIDFQCFPGRVFGLLGPNGAGKTTTLRILSTVLRPTSGEVLVNGHDVLHFSERVRASLGFLSGATGLYERSTAREMIAFFGELYGMSPDAVACRTAELAGWLNMGDFIERACGKLSAGQRQKVSLARTIVHDPPVVILDEPTANLDVLVARDVLRFIEGERDRGKTVLMSTHIMSEVDRLADEVGIIHQGRMLFLGTKEAALQGGLTSVESLFFRLVEGAEEVGLA